MESTDDALERFAAALEALGKEERAALGPEAIAHFRRWRRVSRWSEVLGRVLLQFATGPVGFFFGGAFVSLNLNLEAHLNHTVQHGAYAGFSEAKDLDPRNYETLALPMQTATWRLAHKLHHAQPSVLGVDPDTIHPLFRVHDSQKWRPWHLLNTFLGIALVFETWALDYDKVLKERGLREKNDRGEWKKLGLFFLYQYVLWSVLAGDRWRWVLLANVCAVLFRNLVFVVLQTGSSVGDGISTWHHAPVAKRSKGEWYKFQVETSKNYPLPPFGTRLVGGLDRHIEHHLWPWLPPERLRALSPKVKALCERYGVRYTEYPSATASYWESFRYLLRLSLP